MNVWSGSMWELRGNEFAVGNASSGFNSTAAEDSEILTCPARTIQGPAMLHTILVSIVRPYFVSPSNTSRHCAAKLHGI